MRIRPLSQHCRLLTVSTTVAILAVLTSTPVLALLRMGPNVPRASLWKKLYDSLPDQWRTRDVVVVAEVSDVEMDRLVGDDAYRDSADKDSIVDGFYQGGTPRGPAPTITLRRSLKGETAALVFLHEYAHFVWESLVADEDREYFKSIWERQRRARRLVSAYAGDAVEEGFSEAFAYYLRKPALLKKRDPESWRFIDELEPLRRDFDSEDP